MRLVGWVAERWGILARPREWDRRQVLLGVLRWTGIVLAALFLMLGVCSALAAAPVPRLDRDRCNPATETDDHARHPTVAHQQIRAKADHEHRDRVL